MKFGKELKVKIDTLSPEEAEVFIIFLETEIARHRWDIREAEKLVIKVREKILSFTNEV